MSRILVTKDLSVLLENYHAAYMQVLSGFAMMNHQHVLSKNIFSNKRVLV